MKRSAIVVLVLATLTLLGLLCACAAPDVAAGKQQAESIRSSAQAAIPEEERRLAEATTPEEADVHKKNLAFLRTTVAKAEHALSLLEAATKPDGTIDLGSAIGAAGAAAPALITGPVGLGIALGAPFVTWVVENIRKRRALAKAVQQLNEQEAVSHAIVNAIDVAKANSPEFEAAVRKVGPILKAETAKVAGAFEFVEQARV